ncbi:MAG TPA: hypothetical protein VGR37_01875 [Longimicrobiaceae bacterium]|nr:hypothetical protein [Longimicrobiaceae bacterium]
MGSPQERAIVLPFFHAPKHPLRAEHGIFRPMTMDEIEIEYGNADFFTIRAADLDFILGPGKRSDSFETHRWTVLELAESVVPSRCYSALLDLLSGEWKYEMLWREHLRSGKDKTSRPHPRKQRLSESFLSRFNSGSSLLHKERRLRVALLRWEGSYQRTDPLDTVLDCCSCLEASFQMGDELRLRTALAVYYTVRTGKKNAFRSVYTMYGVRNKFIHGASIPEVSSQEWRRYIEITAALLQEFISHGRMPNAESMNRSILSHFGGGDE